MSEKRARERERESEIESYRASERGERARERDQKPADERRKGQRGVSGRSEVR